MPTLATRMDKIEKVLGFAPSIHTLLVYASTGPELAPYESHGARCYMAHLAPEQREGIPPKRMAVLRAADGKGDPRLTPEQCDELADIVRDRLTAAQTAVFDRAQYVVLFS